MKSLFMKWFLIITVGSFNLISFAQQDADDLSRVGYANFSEMTTFTKQHSSFSDLSDAQIRKELMRYIWIYENIDKSIRLETRYYDNDTFLIDVYNTTNKQQKYKIGYVQGSWGVNKGMVCEIYKSSSINSMIDHKENCYKFQSTP